MHLEKYLYIPAFSINLNDFIFIQIYVRENKTELFLAFVSVANINDFGWDDFTILYNINHNASVRPA